MKRFLHPAALIGIAWTMFQLLTAWQGFYSALMQRGIHIAFALGLCFAVYPTFRRRGAKPFRTAEGEIADEGTTDSGSEPPGATPRRWFARPSILSSALLSALGLGTGLYIVLEYDRLGSRVVHVAQVTDLDFVLGLVVLVLVLEACRRVVGVVLPGLATLFLVYQFFGGNLPGLLGHSGISLSRLADQQVLSLQGVYGLPTGVSVDYIFYFVLFAAFLKISGGGELFIDLAMRATGKRPGGPAKAAVVASSLMGTMSGSAVANVVGTGVFTIPLMRRAGYTARFAGAVEAVASTGGQLMPPIMGAAAFIMAEIMGRPYPEIVLAAIIPAIAYYFAAYMMVDLQARKHRLAQAVAVEAGESIINRLHLLLPLAVLIYHFAAGYSLQLSAFRSIIAVVAFSFLRRATRLGVTDVLEGMSDGARQAMTVALPCATAGIIVGVVSYTGLGLKLSSLIIDVSGGVLVVALLMVMLTAIVLGMGMPTSGAYIMAAVLLAPALVGLGVPQMAAHLFIFYFAVLSMVTPPVALASYAAAGISGDRVMGTAWQAVKLSLAAFLVPYAFVLNPALVLEGPWLDTVFTSTTMLLGVAALAIALIGYSIISTTRIERVLFMVSALALIHPERLTDVSGGVVFAALLAFQFWRKRWQTHAHAYAEPKPEQPAAASETRR